jgi:hypothetical protein
MATEKSPPRNRVASRRPLDSIDSLRPSSLPPELGSLDMSWDDDPRSVGAIDLLQHSDLELDIDAGERTTAVPDVPIDQLVESTMAEADARELAEANRSPYPQGDSDRWHDEPTATANKKPEPARRGFEGAFDRQIHRERRGEPRQTQPAPARGVESEGRGSALPRFLGRSAEAVVSPPEPSAPSSRHSDGGILSAGLPPAARSMGGRTGPNSSRPPIPLEGRLSSPPTQRRTEVDDCRHQMKDRYATGDFSGALALAEALLEADSGDLEAQRFVTSCRDVLTQMLSSRIGPFDQIVELALTPEELRWLTLDHRAGFFLSLVDGSSTIDELLDISGMARLESLRILSALIEQRVLRLVPQ